MKQPRRLSFYTHMAGSAPIVLFGLGWAVTMGWRWESGVVLVLTLLCHVAMGILALCILDFKAIAEVYAHLSQYKGYTFREVPFGEYLEAYRKLAGVPNTQQVLVDDLTGGSLAKTVRLVVAQPKPGSAKARLSSQVAHSTSRYTWITLITDPMRLTAPQHFQVLHELGHSSSAANAAAMTSALPMSVVLLGAVPIMLLLADVSGLTAGLLAVYLIATCVYLTMSEVGSALRWLFDETLADYYGLQHCRSEWFARYPLEKLSTAFTSECPPHVKRPILNALLRAFRLPLLLSATSQLRLRRIFFERNIKRMRKGKAPVDPYLPRGMARLVPVMRRTAYAIALAAFLLGLFCATTSGTRLIAFAVTTAILLVAAAIIHQTIRIVCEFIDHELTGRELSSVAKDSINMIHDKKRPA